MTLRLQKDEAAVRAFVFTKLASEPAALEQELLIDRGKFDRVWADENELIEAQQEGSCDSPTPA